MKALEIIEAKGNSIHEALKRSRLSAKEKQALHIKNLRNAFLKLQEKEGDPIQMKLNSTLKLMII